MRVETAEKIDVLHAKIAALIAEEVRLHDALNPMQKSLWRHVAHTRIEQYRLRPADRLASRQMAVLTFPAHTAQEASK